jgi:heme/copper-type cytochrome/quinol oxidase subunit 2
MNPETQAKMNELLTWLMDTVKQSGEFVQSQAPDVARQMVAWGMWSGWCGVAICLLVIAALMAGGVKLIRYGASDKCEHDEGACVGAGLIACVLTTIPLFILFVGAFPTALKATVAPKLYVLEQVGNMLK